MKPMTRDEKRRRGERVLARIRAAQRRHVPKAAYPSYTKWVASVRNYRPCLRGGYIHSPSLAKHGSIEEAYKAAMAEKHRPAEAA